MKLNQARINLLNYINEVWNNEPFINKNIIINGFKKAGIIGNMYLSNDEEKIRDGYIYDLGLNKNFEIFDDIAEEINSDSSLNELKVEEESDDLLDNEKLDIDKKDNQLLNDYKTEIKNFEKIFSFNNLDYMDLDN